MNTANNHVVDSSYYKELSKSQPDYAKQFQQVPDELGKAANAVLKGKREAYASIHSGGKLSKWSAGERKKKRRMQSKSRSKNR
jgi:hypothetical protein